MRTTSALAATALALGTPVAATAQMAAHHDAHQMAQDQSPLLSFSVTEDVRSAPDRASISAGVTNQAPTALEAMRQNSAQISSMIATLRRNGIAERDIQTSGFSLSPQYDHRPQQHGQQPILIGYSVSNQLTVVTRDTTRIGALIDALVAAGGTNISGPNFFVAEPGTMLDAARERAMQTALARADRYARAAGYARARLVSVTEGGGFMPQPVPMMARMEAADAVANVIQPGEVNSGMTLSVQFRLER